MGAQFDLQRFVRYMVVETLVGNPDSYTMRGNNYWCEAALCVLRASSSHTSLMQGCTGTRTTWCGAPSARARAASHRRAALQATFLPYDQEESLGDGLCEPLCNK